MSAREKIIEVIQDFDWGPDIMLPADPEERDWVSDLADAICTAIDDQPFHVAETVTTLDVTDGPKMLRETLCVAQSAIGNSTVGGSRRREHIERLGRLIEQLDAHRPLGPDGKHGERHTPTCGCER